MHRSSAQKCIQLPAKPEEALASHRLTYMVMLNSFVQTKAFPHPSGTHSLPSSNSRHRVLRELYRQFGLLQATRAHNSSWGVQPATFHTICFMLAQTSETAASGESMLPFHFEITPLTIITYSFLWTFHFKHEYYLFDVLIIDLSSFQTFIRGSRILTGLVCLLYVITSLLAARSAFTAINEPCILHPLFQQGPLKELSPQKIEGEPEKSENSLKFWFQMVITNQTNLLRRIPKRISFEHLKVILWIIISFFFLVTYLDLAVSVITLILYCIQFISLVPRPALTNVCCRSRYSYGLQGLSLGFLSRFFVILCSDSSFVRCIKRSSLSTAHSSSAKKIRIEINDFPRAQKVDRCKEISSSHDNRVPSLKSLKCDIENDPINHITRPKVQTKDQSPEKFDTSSHKATPSQEENAILRGEGLPSSCLNSSPSSGLEGRMTTKGGVEDDNHQYRYIYSLGSVGCLSIHYLHMNKVDWFVSRLIQATESSKVIVRTVLPRRYLYFVISRMLSNQSRTVLPDVEGHDRLLLLVSITAFAAEAIYLSSKKSCKPGIGEGLLKMDTDIATWENEEGHKRTLRTNWEGRLQMVKGEQILDSDGAENAPYL